MDPSQLLALLGPGGLLGLGALAVSAYAAIGNRRVATVDAFDKFCSQLMRRLADVEAELERLRAENSALKGRVKELEDERDRLREQIAQLTQRRTRARKGA